MKRNYHIPKQNKKPTSPLQWKQRTVLSVTNNRETEYPTIVKKPQLITSMEDKLIQRS